jgi:hypothetical protein
MTIRAERDLSDTQYVESPHDGVFLGEYVFNQNELITKLSRQSYAGAWSVDQFDWSTPVHYDDVVPVRDSYPRMPRFHPGNTWDKETWQQYEIANLRYLLSQVLHAEQLGVILGGVLCVSGEDWDTKQFGTSLVVDEARHAETFKRYLDRIGGVYPLEVELYSVIEEAMTAREWDKSYLLGHVLLEGLSLGTLGHVSRTAQDPLLGDVLRNVMRDEARHVAYGAGQLPSMLKELSSQELLERQELLAHSVQTLLNRLTPVVVAEEYGIDPVQYRRAMRMSPQQRRLENRLFAHVGPLCARLGLLDANGGWLRKEFEKMSLLSLSDEIAEEAAADLSW